MPIIRKVMPIGGSEGITLPKSWLDWIQRTTGQKITEVYLEVNGKITITPILGKADSIPA